MTILQEVGGTELSRLFADALLKHRGAPVRTGAVRLGIEQEYIVARGRGAVDYRLLAPRLAAMGVAVHPVDPFVHLTKGGLALLADGDVAEAASPPVDLNRGFTATLEAWAATGANLLARTLDPGDVLEGGSTHLSVEVDPEVNDRLCLAYTATYAPGLMVLLDRDHSPGLLVRPRPGRTELCGEYAVGSQLRAAAAYAAGSVIAAARDLKTGGWTGPAPVAVAVEPGRRRHGWYVSRRAFGPDLYSSGRATTLHRLKGGTTTADAYLQWGWSRARATLEPLVDLADLADADAEVAGYAPLPLECPGTASPVSPAEPVAAPVGRATVVADRPGFPVRLHIATWDFAIFQIGARFAVVPHRQLEPFLDLLDRGELDATLAAYTSLEAQGRTIRSHGDTTAPGLYDEVQRSDALLPEDRMGVGPGRLDPLRPGKRIVPPQQPPSSPPHELTPSKPEPADGGGDQSGGEGPRLGSLLWVGLVLLSLIAGLLVGSSNRTASAPTAAPAASTILPTVPSTSTSTSTSTTLRPAPVAAMLAAFTGGWDHPPFAATYTNAVTGQPVVGLSVILACIRVSGAGAGAYVVVSWAGPGGTIQGAGRLDASGGATVPAGINSPGSYTVQSVQVAPSGNSVALTTLSTPGIAPTIVTLPNDRLCTP